MLHTLGRTADEHGVAQAATARCDHNQAGVVLLGGLGGMVAFMLAAALWLRR